MSALQPESGRPAVAVLTEGTYPYSGGGVSTWCDKLVLNLADHDFHFYAVTPKPLGRPRYELPRNVRSVTQIPLWEIEHPAQWLDSLSASTVMHRRLRTTDEAIEAEFVPHLDSFLGAFDALDRVEAATAGMVGMRRFFQRFDYDVTLKSAPLYRAVVSCLGGEWAREMLRGATASVADAEMCARWLYAFLAPLMVPALRADAVHATAAAFSAFVGLAAKVEQNIPFILTEHGVYLRERYIAVEESDMTQMPRAFLVRLSALVSRLCYAHADLVVPVCEFNMRWELPQGVRGERLRVVPNSVDVETFRPREKPRARRGRPTVVVAARVFPLKDLETMVRAAEVVRRSVPDVHFLIYGSVNADPPYTERVRGLIRELGLERCVELAGVHEQPSLLYNEGDISALSSISEGFPYTVLESMACARPVVATDVGGVAEALGRVGRLVPPRDPEALGSACVDFLLNDDLRLELGRRARERVVLRFRDDRIYEQYRQLYGELIEGRASRPEAPIRPSQEDVELAPRHSPHSGAVG